MAKAFITHICPVTSEANQSVLRRDTSPVCSVQNPNNNNRNIPCVQQVVKVSSGATPIGKVDKNVIRPRSKSRNRKSASKQSFANTTRQQSWSSVVNSTCAYPIYCRQGDFAVDASDGSYPVLLTPSVPNVDTTPSYPTCSCASKISSRCAQNYSLPAQSASQLTPFVPIRQGRSGFGETVNNLKNELDIVKSQVENLVAQRSDILCGKGEPLKQIYQLRCENKHLKRQLDLKRKLYNNAAKDVDKAKGILQEYERKVCLLHQQALKSSKIMKQTKDKFCKCLQEKEKTIKELKVSNCDLRSNIIEKEMQYSDLNKLFEKLQIMVIENNDQYAQLKENNQHVCERMKELEKQLEAACTECGQYKNEVETLKQKVNEESCNKSEICEKLESKIKKQKERYENRIQEYESNEVVLIEQITKLTTKIEEVLGPNMSVDELQAEYKQLQQKLQNYEKFASKCKELEDDCKRQCESSEENERKFERDRAHLRQLVDELTNVIKENKATIIELSMLNREQEAILQSQSLILTQREEELKAAGSEMEMLRKKSSELEQAIDEMRSQLTGPGPCAKEECASLSKELQGLKAELLFEKDHKLLKEKIIEEQSRTITTLQQQIKDKIVELNKAREESSIASEEIVKINDDLLKKHRELERELDEKGRLMHKLKKLEMQKSALSSEMADLEHLLDRYCHLEQHDEAQHQAIVNLRKQVVVQRREWENQKLRLAEEKEKAVKAAKFATQKLIDTVADFQKQVTAQRKVQVMLTKLLHDKEEELQDVKDKISSINTIVSTSSSVNADLQLNEIFKRNLSNPTTSISFDSSCSGSVKAARSKTKSKSPKTELQEIFEAITKTDEIPVKI